MRDLVIKILVNKETNKVEVYGRYTGLELVEGKPYGSHLYTVDTYDEALEFAERMVELHNVTADYKARVEL